MARSGCVALSGGTDAKKNPSDLAIAGVFCWALHRAGVAGYRRGCFSAWHSGVWRLMAYGLPVMASLVLVNKGDVSATTVYEAPVLRGVLVTGACVPRDSIGVSLAGRCAICCLRPDNHGSKLPCLTKTWHALAGTSTGVACCVKQLQVPRDSELIQAATRGKSVGVVNWSYTGAV